MESINRRTAIKLTTAGVGTLASAPGARPAAHAPGVMKVTAQLYPLKPGEPREARLEVQRNGAWVEVAKAAVLCPGWDAHFRATKWDATKGVAVA